MREMKDSGIEWIGKIPRQWDCVRGKTIFALRNEKGNIVEELLSATQLYGMYPQRLMEGVVQTKEETDLQKFKTVHKNDYVISLRSFQGGFEMSDYEGVCSPAYQVIYATKSIDYAYYKRLFKSDGFISKLNSLTVGIREGKNIQYKDFSTTFIPCPAVEEQKRIADYLDKKCVKIDSIIEKQQKIIEKLKEYKLSVITEAVTKGLNPNVEMKDSGVHIIGKVPKHWQVIPLKYLYDNSNGSAIRVGPFGSAMSGSDIVDSGVWVYNQRTILDTNFTDNDTFVTEEKAKELSSFKVEVGDILVTTRGTIGKTVIVPKNAPIGVLHPCVIRFRIDNNIYDDRLIVHLFNDTELAQRQILDMSNSTTIEVLYSYSLKEIKIPIPPAEEQGELLSWIRNKIKSMDDKIQKKQELVDKLQEYKKSLIYEVVTGKREV